MATVFLGLGSNLGDGVANLNCAIGLIQERIGQLLVQSTFIESEPWGFVSEHGFTNAVVAIETQLQPLDLLHATQTIEKEMGRVHKHQKGEPYKDRIIDIDILRYEDLRFEADGLCIPHPLINERDFVKIPLSECLEKLSMMRDTTRK